MRGGEEKSGLNEQDQTGLTVRRERWRERMQEGHGEDGGLCVFISYTSDHRYNA